jgi:aspartate aminotransferase
MCVDRTRAILVTNPNNPTGWFAPEMKIESISKRIRRDLFIIAVESTASYYDDAELSASRFPQVWDRLVISTGVSKTIQRMSVRIGCLASKNKEFIAQGIDLCQSGSVSLMWNWSVLRIVP